MKKSILFAMVLGILTLGCSHRPPADKFRYEVAEVGPLLVSNSPSFGDQVIVESADRIEVRSGWILYNTQDQDLSLDLQTAKALVDDKTFPVNCTSPAQNGSKVRLAARKNTVVNCIFRPTDQELSYLKMGDRKITLVIPFEKGVIKNDIFARAEDFR